MDSIRIDCLHLKQTTKDDRIYVHYKVTVHWVCASTVVPVCHSEYAWAAALQGGHPAADGVAVEDQRRAQNPLHQQAAEVRFVALLSKRTARRALCVRCPTVVVVVLGTRQQRAVP